MHEAMPFRTISFVAHSQLLLLQIHPIFILCDRISLRSVFTMTVVTRENTKVNITLFAHIQKDYRIYVCCLLSVSPRRSSYLFFSASLCSPSLLLLLSILIRILSCICLIISNKRIKSEVAFFYAQSKISESEKRKSIGKKEENRKKYKEQTTCHIDAHLKGAPTHIQHIESNTLNLLW